MPLRFVYSGDMPSPIAGHAMDPRLPLTSSATPDCLRARIDAALSGNRVGGVTEWASELVASRARSMSRYDPKRKQLLTRLEEKADALEKERAEKKRKMELSPALAPLLLKCEETAVNAVRQRSRLATESCGPVFPEVGQ